VWITTICASTWEVLVVHRNAPLSETGRLRLARCVVDDGWAAAPGRGTVPGLSATAASSAWPPRSRRCLAARSTSCIPSAPAPSGALAILAMAEARRRDIRRRRPAAHLDLWPGFSRPLLNAQPRACITRKAPVHGQARICDCDSACPGHRGCRARWMLVFGAVWMVAALSQ
jgi:hypothetical protein